MWKTLLAISKGRAILLTTHSMEESSALANRVGIMAQRMLALGTIEQLRKTHGDMYYVHIVLKTAPHSSAEEMDTFHNWVRETFPGAEVDRQSYHGQMRFNVPSIQSDSSVKAASDTATDADEDEIKGELDRDSISQLGTTNSGGILSLIVTLDEHKERLGIEAFSVSPTTLDTVFLNIVQKHNVEEEGYRATHTDEGKKKRTWWKF